MPLLNRRFYAILCLLIAWELPGLAQTCSALKSFGISPSMTGAYPLAPLAQASDGTLYSSSSSGFQGGGALFKIRSDGTGLTVLKWFTNNLDGLSPQGSLALSGTTLYGTTWGGGLSNLGTVFKINTDGSGYTVLKSFTGPDGSNPAGGIILSDGVLYGTTKFGGGANAGTVFKVNTDGSGYTVLWASSDVAGTGAFPASRLTLSGGILYGTAIDGAVFKLGTDGSGFAILTYCDVWHNSNAGVVLSGTALYGTAYGLGGQVFKVNTDGSGFTVLTNVGTGTDATQVYGGLVVSGDTLYGTACEYQAYGFVFKMKTDGSGFTVLGTFSNTNGNSPMVDLILSGNTLFGTTEYGGTTDEGTVFRINTDGSGFNVVANITDSDGSNPYAGLALSGATLYGTTYNGGDGGHNAGTVFKVNLDGTGDTLVTSFVGSGGEGGNPRGGLAVSDTTLYGTTYYGGISNKGTIFAVNKDGTGFTVLKSFLGTDGAFPYAGPVLSGGALYGTAYSGGWAHRGVVYAVSTDGSWYQTLVQFSGAPDGAYPYADLLLSGSTLYGVTSSGGSRYGGTVFQVNTDGSGYSVLVNFAGSPDGSSPRAKLTVSGNTLYGTTYWGGTSGMGTVFTVQTDSSQYAVLKSFTGVNGDGAYPWAGLVLRNNALYGTTYSGGIYNTGTVFKINTDGSGYAVLKSFSARNGDGASPYGTLVCSGNTLYGTTYGRGLLAKGEVFALDLSPVVSVIPSGSTLSLQWTATAGSAYQLQYKTSLTQPNWINLGAPLAVTNANITASDNVGPDPQRFYRVILQ